WTLTSVPAGSRATLSNPTSASPGFIPDLSGPYSVQVTLTDDQGHTSAATTLNFSVTCDAATPVVVSAGSPSRPDFWVTQSVPVVTAAGNKTLSISRGAATHNTVSLSGGGTVNSPQELYQGFSVQLNAN